MSNIAIIPARGGSVRIPRKNIKTFYGRPIIEYSIEAAKASNLFDEIVVSTDDPAIAIIAAAMGARIHQRSEADAKNEVGTQTVMKHVLKVMYSRKRMPKYACCVYPTSPMLLPVDLTMGFAQLYRNKLGFCYSADQNRSDAGQFYWGYSWAFLGELPLHGPLCSTVMTIPANRVCDINTLEDWARAEKMYADLIYPKEEK
ncbi:MAG: cytidylyltransferase domain-containing protein [Bellilinea sp.]